MSTTIGTAGGQPLPPNQPPEPVKPKRPTRAYTVLRKVGTGTWQELPQQFKDQTTDGAIAQAAELLRSTTEGDFDEMFVAVATTKFTGKPVKLETTTKLKIG